MTETPKRGRPRKTPLPDDLPVPNGTLSAPADAPPLDAPSLGDRHKKQVQVIQRRLKGGHVFTSPSQAIPLKDKTMRVRWFNRGISDDRFFVAEHQKGWIKVHKTDVASLDMISGYTITPEGYVTRGARGEEMLYMIPIADYERIARAKAEANVSRLGSSQKRKLAAAEATAAAFGPEAGDFIEKAEDTTEVWRGPDG